MPELPSHAKLTDQGTLVHYSRFDELRHSPARPNRRRVEIAAVDTIFDRDEIVDAPPTLREHHRDASVRSNGEPNDAVVEAGFVDAYRARRGGIVGRAAA